ncbi:MAG: prepilin-type N-terminal cleavage/methylation domain-containing protein [Gemmataceae bacterium]|nr:prepilin-type N-terminal cleavage/methylation domain-containing protein [Gemmataceae bacterium]MDW8266974.1 prepilin-type N-terminal cleavage/methylation domain-containing protein [Gemmataceae bacterium]
MTIRFRDRRAFTLVEVMVVMVIIVVLLGLSAAFLPRALENSRAIRGAEQLQGWLLIAKNRAVREKRASGVILRLASETPDDPGHNDPRFAGCVQTLNYIQQPDDFTGGMFVKATGATLQFSGVDFRGGLGEQQKSSWPVQKGDYVEVQGGGLVAVIAEDPGTATLTCPSWAGRPPVPPTSQYRIIRGPRVLSGEAKLLMPQDVVIDLRLSRLFPSGQSLLESGVRWLLFSPSGSVSLWGAANNGGKIVLWIRDVNREPTEGEPTLIVIDVRTGLIAAHPVAKSGGDPYRFALEPRSSGM